ncbi:Rad17 cell cycle checkpoint protein-domain-containing protein [Blastocladiella britannica]|nr:Rad17 cell cycle checkpoint protein-domain-containing protein [Blastocladiella britannica]
MSSSWVRPILSQSIAPMTPPRSSTGNDSLGDHEMHNSSSTSSKPAAKKRKKPTASIGDARTRLARRSTPTLSRDTLWIDEYRPASMEDLSIHKAKTTQSQPFLIMKGATGTGKSSVLERLCADSHLRLVEWTNPLLAGSSDASTLDDSAVISATATASFLDFFVRGSLYAEPTDVLLVREFPILSRAGLAKLHAAMHGMLLRRNRIPRIVFILTTFNTPSSDFDDTIAHRNMGYGGGGGSNLDVVDEFHLVPPDCKKAFHVISFNAVAPTYMKKALKRIADARGLSVDTASIITSSRGDLRSAINTLQFSNSDVGGAGDDTLVPPPLLACTQDQWRSLFSGVGRAMYAQRVPPPGAAVVSVPLPPHLQRFDRAVPLEVDPTVVMTNLPVAHDLYAMYLHSNYPLYRRTLSKAAAAAEAFSRYDAGRRAIAASCDLPPAIDLALMMQISFTHDVTDQELDRDLSALAADQTIGIDWDDFDGDRKTDSPPWSKPSSFQPCAVCASGAITCAQRVSLRSRRLCNVERVVSHCIAARRSARKRRQ